jgi:hypothetical protein
MASPLSIRLVVKENLVYEPKILKVMEMDRHLKNGKRDLQSLERLLNEAHEAIKNGQIPTFEFLIYPE